ncbi:ABC transporter ATP-binding protein [Amedibacillus sp. YH-ame10]
MTILNVSHVEKYYGNSGNLTKALDDISFTMDEHEFTVIMGASGSGKSTLLNVISTMDMVSAGSITIGDMELSKMNENQMADFRKKELGFIFQDFNLLDTLSLHENIAMPLVLCKENPKVIDEKVVQYAKILGIEDLLDRYPYEVSGGQRQRCACARAIIHHPSIVMADEPTGALDSHSSYLLMERFLKMNQEEHATILMVTHDVFAASYAKRILFLKDGKIYNEIYRGNQTRKDFFQSILDVMTLLGGDVHDVR